MLQFKCYLSKIDLTHATVLLLGEVSQRHRVKFNLNESEDGRCDQDTFRNLNFRKSFVDFILEPNLSGTWELFP